MKPTHEHKDHPGIAPKWHSLHPSCPSGTYFCCYVQIGTHSNGDVRYCSEEYFEPSERCDCAPGNHGTHYTGNPYQPIMANRTIWNGICSVCGLIVPGCEDEADSCGDNW